MKTILLAVVLVGFVGCCFGQDTNSELLQYKLLATTRTSTMQKEMDETSAQGYRILVGSPTSGSEMAVFMSRDGTVKDPYKYKLLATTRTGTMQKELNEAADGGFRLIPSTMIAKKQVLGGVEIVMIMEQPPKVVHQYEYKLLATSRTSTLQKEVTEAVAAGFVIVGMVSRDEHMVVMERATVSPQ
ncbi:MAG: hypothetical protein ABI878_04460 [Acidobacteriota bacterium]